MGQRTGTPNIAFVLSTFGALTMLHPGSAAAAAEDCRLPADNYRPNQSDPYLLKRSRIRSIPPRNGTCSSHCPSIIVFHGGGLVGGSIDECGYVQEARKWAERGYHVFQAEYRIASPQPGERKFPYPAAFNDAVAAADWVKTEGARKYGIDPNQISAVGGSAGGALATYLAVKKKVRATVTYAGIGNFWLDYKANPSQPTYWIGLWLGCDAVQGAGAERLAALESTVYAQDCSRDPDGARLARSCPGRCALLHEASPAILNRQNPGSPVLAVHGKSDHMVPYIHALSWDDGRNPKPILIPGIGHSSLALNESRVPGARGKVVQRADAFLRQMTRSRQRMATRHPEVECRPGGSVASPLEGWL